MRVSDQQVKFNVFNALKHLDERESCNCWKMWNGAVMVMGSEKEEFIESIHLKPISTLVFQRRGRGEVFGFRGKGGNFGLKPSIIMELLETQKNSGYTISSGWPHPPRE